MSLNELYDLVLEFFGYKASNVFKYPKAGDVGCMLYDSFEFMCGLDDQYGSFGASIYIGSHNILTDPLANDLFANGNEESIRKKLQIVDDYCRLRLPDKFLEAYDRAYKDRE
jgi:hypothetical protein